MPDFFAIGFRAELLRVLVKKKKKMKKKTKEKKYTSIRSRHKTMKSCKQLNEFLYTHHIDYFKTNTATLKVAGGTETISAKRDSRDEAHRCVNDRQVRRERQALCPATAEHGF